MEKKMILKNITQVDSRGVLLFQDVAVEKKESDKVVCQVAITFNDPKAVAHYDHGKVYTVSVSGPE